MLPSPQVWSNHSARFGALHVCTSTVSSHSLQRTAQHQWNLHSHLVMRVTRVVSYPRPQHITSQPSVPRDILLHTRPAVPREPGEGSESRSGCPFSILFKRFLPPGPATVSSDKTGYLPSATETSGTAALAVVTSRICHSTCRSTVPRCGFRRLGTGCGEEVAEPVLALLQGRGLRHG